MCNAALPVTGRAVFLCRRTDAHRQGEMATAGLILALNVKKTASTIAISKKMPIFAPLNLTAARWPSYYNCPLYGGGEETPTRLL